MGRAKYEAKVQGLGASCLGSLGRDPASNIELNSPVSSKLEADECRLHEPRVLR